MLSHSFVRSLAHSLSHAHNHNYNYNHRYQPPSHSQTHNHNCILLLNISCKWTSHIVLVAAYNSHLNSQTMDWLDLARFGLLSNCQHGVGWGTFAQCNIIKHLIPLFLIFRVCVRVFGFCVCKCVAFVLRLSLHSIDANANALTWQTKTFKFDEMIYLIVLHLNFNFSNGDILNKFLANEWQYEMAALSLRIVSERFDSRQIIELMTYVSKPSFGYFVNIKLH